MGIAESRKQPAELERISDVVELIPKSGKSVLDIGARDGYITQEFTSFADEVTALDLQTPQLDCNEITCVKGDVTELQYPDSCFDTVVCTEVLEHIPPELLQKACDELTRVSRHYVVIGVPYKEDTRVGRTTCLACKRKNPPWGHQNRFDEDRIVQLFPKLQLEQFSFVGRYRSRTNYLSMVLLDLAGNPYGTYQQQEKCIYCNATLKEPPSRTLLKRAMTRFGCSLQGLQHPFVSETPRWIHALFRK